MTEVLNLKELAQKSSKTHKPRQHIVCTPFAFEKVPEEYRYPDMAAQTNKLGERFPIIDLQFLTMRRNGFPRFAVYNLNHSEAFVSVRVRIRDKEVYPGASFPELFNKYFQDVFAKLTKRALWHTIGESDVHEANWKITAPFKGLIPEPQRKLINKEKNHFDGIYIIAEAPEWNEQGHLTYFPPNPDPLIVGVKWKQTFLLDTFDTTTIEAYVSKEFTSSETHNS